jgi:hypothetical protein
VYFTPESEKKLLRLDVRIIVATVVVNIIITISIRYLMCFVFIINFLNVYIWICFLLFSCAVLVIGLTVLCQVIKNRTELNRIKMPSLNFILHLQPSNFRTEMYVPHITLSYLYVPCSDSLSALASSFWSHWVCWLYYLFFF